MTAPQIACLALVIFAPMIVTATYLGSVLRRRDEELRAWGREERAVVDSHRKTFK